MTSRHRSEDPSVADQLPHQHLPVDRLDAVEPWHGTICDLAVKYAASDARILDVGCGYGQIASLIHKALPSATFEIADAYQGCIEITSKRVPQVVQSHLIDEHEFDLLAHVQGPFDLIIMSHVLEHLFSPVAAMRDVVTLLKPGGYLIVAVPNPARPDVLIRSVFRRSVVNKGHVVAWDRSHWINFLETILGLDVVEYAADTLTPFPGRLGRFLGHHLGPGLARLFPWLSLSNIAVIRR